MDETHWQSVPGTIGPVRWRRNGDCLELATTGPAIFRIGVDTWQVRPDPPRGSPRQPGAKGYDLQFYKQVVEDYVELRERFPDAPAKELARRYDRTAATVQRWLGKCEQMGLLTRERH